MFLSCPLSNSLLYITQNSQQIHTLRSKTHPKRAEIILFMLYFYTERSEETIKTKKERESGKDKERKRERESEGRREGERGLWRRRESGKKKPDR